MGHEICVVTIKNDVLDNPLNLPIDADVQARVRIEKVPLPHKMFDIYTPKQNRYLNNTTTNKPKTPPTIFGKLIKKIKAGGK